MENKTTSLEKLMQSLETAPAARLCAKIGSFTAFLIVAFTGYQIAVDLDDREMQRAIFEEERAERQEAEKLRAWSYFLDPALPPHLRGAAFNTLVKGGETLNGIMIGCPFDDGSNTDEGYCRTPSVLSGIEMLGSNAGYLNLDRVAFIHASLKESSLSIAGAVNYFDQSEITGSAISFAGSGNGILNSALTGSAVYLDYTQIFTVAMSNISGTCFAVPPSFSDGLMPAAYQLDVRVASNGVQAAGPEPADITLDKVWAYADNPPGCSDDIQNPIPVIEHITLCDPDFPVELDRQLLGGYNFFSRSYFDKSVDRHEGRLTLQVAAALYSVEQVASPNEVLLGAFRGCHPMTIVEAATTYPDRYTMFIVEE